VARETISIWTENLIAAIDPLDVIAKNESINRMAKDVIVDGHFRGKCHGRSWTAARRQQTNPQRNAGNGRRDRHSKSQSAWLRFLKRTKRQLKKTRHLGT
jgi:hypothetical protein